MYQMFRYFGDVVTLRTDTPATCMLQGSSTEDVHAGSINSCGLAYVVVYAA